LEIRVNLDEEINRRGASCF